MAYVQLVYKNNNPKPMITPKITNCKECASISQLIADIDCKIFEMSKRVYNNIIFSLNKHVDYITILDLLNYKRILEYKFANPNYICEISVDKIANRVKLLKYK